MFSGRQRIFRVQRVRFVAIDFGPRLQRFVENRFRPETELYLLLPSLRHQRTRTGTERERGGRDQVQRRRGRSGQSNHGGNRRSFAVHEVS